MECFIDETKRRKLDRPFTGVIQEDRIWEQWYTKTAMEKPFPKMNEKDYLFSCIGDEPDRIVLNNRGFKKYTVNDLKKMIEDYECSFTAAGLKKGDTVCFIGLGTPELWAMRYAVTTLGAKVCFQNILDVGKTDDGVNRLYRQTKEVNPNMIFVLDYFQDKVSHIINDSQFKDVLKVTMPLDYSAPILYPERIVLALKRFKDAITKKNIKNSLMLSDFYALGKTVKFEDVKEVYEENLVCNIAWTSGTTGISKGCLLTHDANNILAFQQEIADFGFKKGSRHLAVLPPFLAFWDADVTHVTHCLGAEIIFGLSPDPKSIAKDLLKYKDINILMCPQYQFNAILEMLSPKEREVLKQLRIGIIGGERAELNALIEYYKETGIWLFAGYGASELNTTFAVTHPNCYKPGTSGVILPHSNARILDSEGRDLTYNQPGRLLASSPCMMQGYLNNKELTDRVISVDNKGTKWYDTGDYAFIDPDGVLKVLDRYSDPIVVNERVINLLDDAEIIKENKNIKVCKLTSSNGKIILHLALNPFAKVSEQDAVNSIIETIKQNLDYTNWPDIIKVYDGDLVRTYVGKVDPEKTQQIGEELAIEYPSEVKLYVVSKNKTKKKK